MIQKLFNQPKSKRYSEVEDNLNKLEEQFKKYEDRSGSNLPEDLVVCLAAILAQSILAQAILAPAILAQDEKAKGPTRRH